MQKVILKSSSNIFQDIMLPMSKRRNSNDNSVYVYFYRYIGFDNELEYVKTISFLHKKLCELKDLYLNFEKRIPFCGNSQIINTVNAIWNTIKIVDINNGALICALENKNVFDITSSPKINNRIKVAVEEIIKIYNLNESNLNLSKMKNFIAKLMGWVEKYIPGLFTSPMLIYNPKVVYYGDIKKHEFYFLILLSRIGCDVLFINPLTDHIYKKVDPGNKYSMLLEGAVKTKLKTSPMQSAQKQVEQITKNVDATTNTYNNPSNIPNRSVNIPNPNFANKQKNIAITKIIKPSHIFDDIAFPLCNRSSYVGTPYPILPVYFCRYIGIDRDGDEAKVEYYNAIYNLDKKLSGLKNGYLKFTTNLPIPINNKINNSISNIWDQFKSFDKSKKDLLIAELINAKVLSISSDSLMNNTINKAFQEVVDVYLANEDANINLSMVKNFILKLIMWIYEYYYKLFKNVNYQESPKIVFYGNIKLHEIFLLIFFSKLGCDVLYINSEITEDNLFKKIDPQEIHTKLIEHSRSETLEQFPKTEQVIRKNTVAFNASQEIENVIYGEEVGLFKAWQFEESITRPITLKTTYDELKILWKEDAKIRPEFKVENNVVYVPNLFAKIRGTHENINEYWQDFKQIKEFGYTHLIDQVPFTKITYSTKDMYESAYLFDNSRINKEKLMNSQLYRYGYLKTSLQHFIIYKIEELIGSTIFKFPVDKVFKLKILMTVLNLDNQILNLIERFDYTKQVPKLIIYDNKRDMFSDEDAITIGFLNLIGIDIVIFTPTNYNNIEQKLKEDFFDTHQLPAVEFDLAIPSLKNFSMHTKKSLLARIFKP